MFALRAAVQRSPRVLLARTYAAPASSKGRKQKDTALTADDSLFKTYHPFTPGVRHLRNILTPHLYAGRPLRALTVAKRKHGGRNSTGRITVRHRGGGHRQRIRLLDFRREKGGIWDVVRIEYDPTRTSHVALVKHREDGGEWAYILATDGMRAGDQVRSFRSGIPEGFIKGLEGQASRVSLALGIFRSLTIKSGNVLPLRLIPPGTIVHNVGLTVDGPGILARAAGASAQVMGHEEDGQYSLVRLQSGEVRKIRQGCCATIGRVSNHLHEHRVLGKAGRRRWMGWRPEVRGVAMNAKDHPHGGGRGKSKSNKHPVSIWGWGTQGTRTRKPGPKGPKNSNKYVVRERPRGKDKNNKGLVV
ncbi:translation protein SH3-like domain-containing protein [Mucidula mucida]|nr:translation protein SH3-like domain-containing protein [Mucidula mucida]